MEALPPPPAPFSTERARATVAVSVIFVVLATLAVIARFWSRRLKRTKPALDDWLIIAGLVFYYLCAVQTILQVCLGRLGHHINDGPTPDQIIVMGKLGTYGQYAYALAMGFIRWSICSLLYRIFITKTFRRAIFACNVLNILWIVFSIFIVSFRCTPFSKNWNITEPGTCLAQVPIVSTIAAWGLAIEVTIWCLPIPATWALQIPRSAKIAISLIFGLGIFDIGVGVGRLVTVLQVDERDFTWTEAPALQWLAIEPSIAIIVCCACVCRPLMEKILPRRWRHTSSGSKSTRSTADDHIRLVDGTSGIGHGTTRVDIRSESESAGASQTEPEGPQKNAVHVRKDIIINADNIV
ncbi:MAG: hypothetical protein Q9164_003982 [Protoblastenia rupestris]